MAVQRPAGEFRMIEAYPGHEWDTCILASGEELKKGHSCWSHLMSAIAEKDAGYGSSESLSEMLGDNAAEVAGL